VNQYDGGTVASLEAARKRGAAEKIVICLACAAAHEKPAGTGTLATNPGCPTCGYVGWIGVARLTRRDAAAPRELSPV
jgi:hypothetical protein